MKCNKEGCKSTEGLAVPSFRLWAKGYDRKKHDPAEIKLHHFTICTEHQPDLIKDVEKGMFNEVFMISRKQKK